MMDRLAWRHAVSASLKIRRSTSFSRPGWGLRPRDIHRLYGLPPFHALVEKPNTSVLAPLRSIARLNRSTIRVTVSALPFMEPEQSIKKLTLQGLLCWGCGILN